MSLLNNKKWIKGTPERAISDFFFAWSLRDFDAMYRATVYSWRKKQSKNEAVKYLKAWYGGLRLREAVLLPLETVRELRGKEDIYAVYPEDVIGNRELADEYISRLNSLEGRFFVKAKVKIVFKYRGRRITDVLSLSIICEQEGLGIDPGGDWGVYPAMAIPTVTKEKK